MSVSRVLLALLESTPRHGYDLKRAHDKLFRADRPLAYGQVYATLALLLKNGLVTAEGTAAGEGPDRKLYAITDAGVSNIDAWLNSPEKPSEYLQNTLYTKVVLALLSDRNADQVLDAQRREHLTAVRQYTRRKESGDPADQLICDYALFHLEADLRWLDVTAARLTELLELLSE